MKTLKWKEQNSWTTAKKKYRGNYESSARGMCDAIETVLQNAQPRIYYFFWVAGHEISSKKSEKESGTKKFDKNTIDQISSNLDKLDEIIKRLDEDN